jgi:hypothetical protein
VFRRKLSPDQLSRAVRDFFRLMRIADPLSHAVGFVELRLQGSSLCWRKLKLDGELLAVREKPS